MHRKSFRAALWVALLALGLQLVAGPISSRLQAAQWASGLEVVCMSSGTNTIKVGNAKELPGQADIHQVHCPLCSIGNQTPALTSTQNHILNGSALSGLPPLSSIQLIPHNTEYPSAAPRAPPALLHA